jgi:hypothetical protein
MGENLSTYIVIAFIAVSVIMSYIALKANAGRKRREKEGAGDLAAYLGFSLLEPEEAIRRSYGRMGDSGAAMYDKLPPALLNLVKKNAPWMIEGTRDGFPVSIYQDVRGSKNQTTYTVVRVGFREALGFELHLTREGRMTKVGKGLFHLQDIELGDADIDPFVRIKSTDPEAARRVLSTPAARRALVASISGAPGFRATSSFVDWESVGNITDPSAITAVLAALLPLAAALGSPR